jgi:UDP-glucose 4-epimerase
MVPSLKPFARVIPAEYRKQLDPLGAHASGLIAEDPNNTSNNVMPSIAQVAMGSASTRVRDYIHLVDLAGAHLAALSQLLRL